MTSRATDYAPEITAPSQHELEKIANWAASAKETPFLVGGWAVYYYVKPFERPSAKYGKTVYGKTKHGNPFGFEPLGSKDIDLIFKNKDCREKFERDFCEPNGYRKRKNPLNIFDRPVTSKTVAGTEIILDTDTLATTWKTSGAKVSWKPLEADHASLVINDNSSLKAPSKELLIAYKCGALVDRSDEILAGRETEYLRSKVWKDSQDVLALTKTGYDAAKLGRTVKRLGWAAIVDGARKIITERKAEYGLEQLAEGNAFLRETD